MLIHRESHTGSHTYQNEDKHYTLTLTQQGRHDLHSILNSNIKRKIKHEPF